MAGVPRSSIPSVARMMQNLRVEDKAEKGLMVRIGTLIDAIVEAQRGVSNAGQVTRRANVNNLKKPKLLTGSTENLFNAASVTIDPSDSAANLSHHEVQIDANDNFSDPTTKTVFGNSTTFKGLLSGSVYNIRVRPVTKDGQVGDWSILDQVATVTGNTSADLDGDKLGQTVESKVFTISSAAQQFFCTSALGFQQLDTGFVFETDSNTATDVSIKDRIGTAGVYTDIETIDFPGVSMSAVSTGYNNKMVLTRPNPIVFFTLITPSVGSYPATRTLDVQFSSGGGAYSNSTEDTVWVEF